MDKIKSILRPGGGRDDEIMYGTPESKSLHPSSTTADEGGLGSETGQASETGMGTQQNPGESMSGQAPEAGMGTAQSSSEPAQLRTDPGVEKKEHGVLSQIFNPKGEKYSEQRYGTTAHAEPDPSTAQSSSEPAQLRTDPGVEKKEHGVLSQILNPNGEKYTEQRYGTTAHSDKPLTVPTTGSEVPADSQTAILQPAAADADKGGIKNQILNPHGDKYDAQRFGDTGSAVTGTTLSPSKDHGDAGSVMSIKSGVAGPYASDTNTEMVASGAGSTSTAHQDSQFGRDAALGGGAAVAAGGVGAAGYEAKKHHDESTPTTSNPQTLGDVASMTPARAGYETGNQSSGLSATSTSQPQADHSALRSAPGAQTDDSHLGRDAALGGAAVAGIGATGYEANKHLNESSTTSTAQQPSVTSGVASSMSTPQPEDDISRATYTARSFPLGGGATAGPSSTIASTAPETGSLAGGAVVRDRSDPSMSTGDSHLGRDAAIGGGLGAGALGAGALASHSHDSQPENTNPRTLFPTDNTSVPPSTSSATGNETTPGHQAGITSSMAAGASGAGVLASHNQDDVTSATYTDRAFHVGGHRDDEKPHEGYVHHAQGPHATDTANRLDPGLPHVPGEFPTESGEDPHAHGQASTSGRDAAIGTGAAFGAGGIGAAGYEATRSHEPSATSAAQPSTSSSNYTGGQGSPIMTTTNTRSSFSSDAPVSQPGDQQHHYGRDSAIAGGLVAGGAGAYGVAKERGDTVPVSTTSGPSGDGAVPDIARAPQPYTSTPHHQTSALNQIEQPRTQTGPVAGPEEKQQHREAAVIGGASAGAGATGLGAYEATRDRNETGPASKTIGPHESNLANVADPRVQPEPEKMKERTTAGPHQSDMLNKADPRVESDPAKAQEGTHNYGRDAGVAAGVGAAGVGAHEATTERGTDSAAATGHHEHNKLHKKNDPRGHTGAAAAHQEEKHEKKLEKAREEESSKSGEHGEKKPSLISRILHPHGKDKDKDHPAESSTSAPATDAPEPLLAASQHAAGAPAAAPGQDGVVIEPHTGLPMNVGKYGSGEGGTDAAPQIAGYHASDAATQDATLGTAHGADAGHFTSPGEGGAVGPDWERIKKANTPY